MSGNLRERETASICALVSLMRLVECPGIQDPDWIDGVMKGEGLPDARASPFLIEHFTIDSTPAQRKLSAQFMNVIDGLEQQFEALPFSLTIAMPEDVAQTGRNWPRQRSALAAWIRDVAPTLSDGHHPTRVAGFDSDFHVWKNRGRLPPGVSFKRWTPSGDAGLAERMKSDVPRKVRKLTAYRREDEQTLLLVESEDIALMSEHVFLSAFRAAFPSGDIGVDATWFCHTLTDSESFFLNVATGDLYLFDRILGAVRGSNSITA